MAVDLIFSFDCEDYITPEAAEAERWWAEALTRHGLPGCLCVVGELARALRDRGDGATIRAMGRHEISYHSDNHSGHPTHAEYLERMEWEEGVAAVMAREARGIEDVADLFGQWPASYCKPGYSWGPPVLEAMRRMGIPALADSPFEWAPGQPIWYENLLGISYHTAFDSYFGPADAGRLARMQADFEEACRRHDGGTVVMYTHPCRLNTAEFWDAENFAGGRNTPRDRWRPAPLRPAAEVEALKQDFDAFLAWVASRKDVRPTSYAQFLDAHRPRWGAVVALPDLLQAASAVGDPPAPVRWQEEWLSPAEVFALAAAGLARYADTGSLPDGLAGRRPLGPTAPQPAPVPRGEVRAPALLAAAREADQAVTRSGALPAQIRVGTCEVGPNVFLQAALSLLPALAGGATPPETVPLRPVAEGCALAAREDLASMTYRDSWPVFAADFDAPRLAEMARWQAWSAKPAVRTAG